MNKMIRITTAIATLGLLATCTDLETDEVDSQVIVNTGGATNALSGSSPGRILQCSGVLLLTRQEFIPWLNTLLMN